MERKMKVSGFITCVSESLKKPVSVKKFSLPSTPVLGSLLKSTVMSQSRFTQPSSSSQASERKLKLFPFNLLSSLSKEELEIIHTISLNRLVLSFLPYNLRIKILTTLVSNGCDLLLILRNDSMIPALFETFQSNFKCKQVESVIEEIPKDLQIFFFPFKSSKRNFDKADLEYFLERKNFEMVVFFDCFEPFAEENDEICKVIESLHEKFLETRIVTFDVVKRKQMAENIENGFKRLGPVVLNPGPRVENLCFKVRENLGYSDLAKFVKQEYSGLQGAVFVNSNEYMKIFNENLLQVGIRSQFYNSLIQKDEKNFIRNQWKNGEIKVLVTSSNSIILKSHTDLKFIIFQSLPKTIEEFFGSIDIINHKQLKIDVVVCYKNNDRFFNLNAISRTRSDPKPHFKMFYNFIHFLETKTKCRNIQIANYFGFEIPCCNICDNCLLISSSLILKRDLKFILQKVFEITADTPIPYEDLLKILINSLKNNAERHGYEDSLICETVNQMIYEEILEESCKNEKVFIEVNKKKLKKFDEYFKAIIANSRQIAKLQERVITILEGANSFESKKFDKQSIRRMANTFRSESESMQGHINQALINFGVVEETNRKF